ncbi:aldo/keto reductase [uncultured Massilia sp.]|uniref:aldo/keto reductase n=1 Tax=uncultured Massilia sp. TaxID=169973 RepID=UPI0025EB81EA|nr:aldo/keto reductase [uncultured Massilia sp.]
MQYRRLGKTGIIVSRLCLGAMTFGGASRPPYDKVGGLALADTDRLVGAALDAGINFIDTADVYAEGESESLLGEVLQGRRDRVVLATKYHAPMGEGPNDAGQSRLHTMQALEASLRRLRTDHVDLYQIHNFDGLTPMEETLRALDDAVRAGKIRYIGCSNLAAWQVAKALGISALHGWSAYVSVQACYSLAVRDIERAILPQARDAGLGVMAWSPLAGGLLSGKISRDNAADQGSRRAHIDFPPVEPEHGLRAIEALRPVAGRHGVSAARVALAWVLAQEGVTCAIVGARRIEQLRDNLGALDVQLTAEDLAELDAGTALPRAYPGWVQAMTNVHRDRFLA